MTSLALPPLIGGHQLRNQSVQTKLRLRVAVRVVENALNDSMLGGINRATFGPHQGRTRARFGCRPMPRPRAARTLRAGHRPVANWWAPCHFVAQLATKWIMAATRFLSR